MATKENWKSKPNWLKGGIVSIIIASIFAVLFFAIQNSIDESLLDIPILYILFILIFIISLPLIIMMSGLGFIIGGNYEVLGQSIVGGIATIILAILYYFILGAGIGLLIEKIKSK